MEVAFLNRHASILSKVLLVAFLSFLLVATQSQMRKKRAGAIDDPFDRNTKLSVNSTTTTDAAISIDHKNEQTGAKKPAAKRRKKKPLPRLNAGSAVRSHRPALRPSNSKENSTCLTQGEPNVPAVWQVRAPHFVLIGAMKAGTEALSFYLRQHPQIPKPKHKEARFFDLKFDKFLTSQGILRKDARRAYTQYMKDDITQGDLVLNDSLFALDNSPRYLFWSDVVPARLLCVAPWVKLVVLLRNPVDRAFSHYNMELGYAGKHPSFEERIQADLHRLKQAGLLQNNETVTTNHPSYKTYARGNGKSGFFPHAILGRGMYALQLRHWFEAMDKIGKPRKDLLAIKSEEMRVHPDRVVNRILEFVGLPAFNITNMEEQHLGKYKSTMRKETRTMLEEFFEPYNQELYQLLGPEWDMAWEPKEQ